MGVTERAEVVVVGGGPAGSSTATWLARAGVDVLLLDRATFPREKACAEYCSPGVADALEDLGALERVLQREHQVLAGMQVVARNQPLPLSFMEDRPNGNQAIGIKRSILDEELLYFAASNGVRVQQSTRVVRPIVENDVVRGVVARSGEHEVSIRAGFVVVADGLHSTVTRALKLDRPVRWPRRLGLVARFSGLPGPIPEGQMHIGDGIYCGLSQVTEAEVNVSLVVSMGDKPAGVPTGEFFDQMVRTLPGIDTLLADARRISSVRGIGPLGKRVRKPSGRGYLLVGDAAGFFDPLTGEGVHRALSGGKLAARGAINALEREDRRPVGYRRARCRSFSEKQLVCNVIQLLLSSRTLLDYVSQRAANRQRVAQPLCGILGDYAPARQALQPGFLWNVVRP